MILKQSIKRGLISSLLYLMRVFPIKRNKIVFSSYHGSKYACNPKYIFEELQLRGEDIDYVWILPKDYPHKPDARTVQERSIRALYELATARVWIDNCRKSIWTRKRKNQYYIQTWHAGISNKKGEKFAENELPEEYIKAAKNDSVMANLFLSNSKWLTNSYRNSFWYEGEIMEKGLPREDMLKGDHQEYHSMICDYYHVDYNSQFVLYAPTFRSNGNLDAYDLDYENLIRVLEKIGGKWYLIVRLHPNIQSQNENIHYSEHVLNGSLYPEINDLIMASDYFISDYSSCLFDAMIAGCRVIIYASDIQEYQKKERNFAFSWEELPFPLATDNDSIADCLLSFNSADYENRVKEFLTLCGFYEVGNASKAVVDRILEVIRSPFNNKK